MMNKKIWTKPLVILAITLSFLLVPSVSSSRYTISIGISICAMAAFGTAWNIIGGYAGQIGFAHAAFFSIGAYAGFLCYLRLGLSPWLGLVIGVAISLLAALFIGTITLKFKGPYFMFCTIAFIKCVETLLLWKKDITGGAAGLVIPVKGNSLATLIFKDTKYYYYIIVLMLALSLFVAWLVERSKAGHYMRAIKADINAAESLGIEPKRYKILAFLISSAIVSAVGTVYAFYMAYIDPVSVGGIDLSTRILAYAVVGGIGQLFGPLLGALVLVPLNDLANALGTGGSGLLFYGLALILIMRFRPKGLISFILDDEGKLRWRRKKTPKEAVE